LCSSVAEDIYHDGEKESSRKIKKVAFGSKKRYAVRAAFVGA
jgi:hypothetical protein